MNGDGRDDFLVGFSLNEGESFLIGAARVYSGANGAILFEFTKASTGFKLGGSAAGAGDVNGDGTPDIVIGAIHESPNGPDSGSAFVFSGLDGTLLHRFDGDAATDALGWSSGGAGDVNADGFGDVIVGAPTARQGGLAVGMARVFSGADGSVLHTVYGTSGSFLGNSVAGVGDVDLDGHDDFVVGIPLDDSAGTDGGAARLYSGATGAVLRTWLGDSAGDLFGYSVAGAGDADLDGAPDVIVGPQFGGYARVFSGADGSVLLALDGEFSTDQFGERVSGAGDIDDDGYADVIVGARIGNYSRVFSGRTGAVLYSLTGQGASWFGSWVAGVGNVNGDAFDDVIVGAILEGEGSARVYAGRGDCADADGDLWTTCAGDCDDGDAALNLDDADGDGVNTCGGDCDDANPSVRPGAPEVPGDGVDDDCDGATDELCGTVPAVPGGPSGLLLYGGALAALLLVRRRRP